MIDDFLSDPKEELKRADHSIYVTLKYTRTTDVIKNTIKRLISAFELSIHRTLITLQKHKKIPEVSPTPRKQAEDMLKIMPKWKEYLKLYEKLIKIDQAPYTKKEEYRKNVALIAQITPDTKEEVNMEALKNFFHKTVEFVEIAQVIRNELELLAMKKETKQAKAAKKKKR
ncbi:MAG: hypothetical protein Q8L34_06655 [Candidatus Woesearchaeota archaeon]|nr:hypothetical protein [Candidatus Woesearchaeota archaeon]